MVKEHDVEGDGIFQEIESEIIDSETETAGYKIATYGADLTLEILANKQRDKEIIVPQFQRKYVWSAKQASKLIESFLLGLPVPQIFLYREENTQDLLVVDGQQRLKTILYYFDGKFDDGTEFYLRGVKPSWQGKTYNKLEESDKRKFKNYILRATIFEQTDPKDKSSIFEIFERLNTGGMPLNQQEIRNCVIRGKINDFLTELNNHPSWRKLFGKTRPDERMRDIEMILRFLSLFANLRNYKKPMKDFISDFMRDKKDMSEKERDTYSTIFKAVMDSILNSIGEKAFKLKAGINVAVFDSITVAIAKVGPDKINDMKNKYEKAIKEAPYLEAVSTSTTDKEKIDLRISLAEQIFSK
jgi:uncharacterized protein with ParB-like and HNH nuclease domain